MIAWKYLEDLVVKEKTKDYWQLCSKSIPDPITLKVWPLNGGRGKQGLILP